MEPNPQTVLDVKYFSESLKTFALPNREQVEGEQSWR